MKLYATTMKVQIGNLVCKVLTKLSSFFKKTVWVVLLLWQTAHAVTLYGHRGARGLAPENTLPAYRVALQYGVDYVDMDVVMTRDGVLVVYHDLTLNPAITRDSTGKWISNKTVVVKNLTVEQIQSYDLGGIKPNTHYADLFPLQKPVPGTHIPTLVEVIRYVKKQAGNRVGFQIEIKTDPSLPQYSASPEQMATALNTIIQQEGIVNRTQVQAFDWRCLRALHKINPHIITAYLTDREGEKNMKNPDPSIAGLWTGGALLKEYQGSIPSMINALGGQLWDPEDRELTKTQLQEAHALGLRVVVWSQSERIDSEYVKRMNQLVAMGVDGIITDRPNIYSNKRQDVLFITQN